MKRTILVVLILMFFPCGFAHAENEELALPVVMYHHISTRSRTWNDYVVSVEEFRSDMEYLKRNGWQSISVEELIAWQRGEFEMPDKPMMITFDDGFASVTEYAEPIMKELGFKGAFKVGGGISTDKSNRMELPRIMILQDHTFDDFIRMVSTGY